MKRLMCFLSITVGMMLLAAEPTVSDVKAKQRYPWNGLVDIDCKVSGIEGATNLWFSLAAVMPDTGEIRNVWNFHVAQGEVGTSGWRINTNGNYRLLWDAKADLGQVIYSNMVVRVNLKAIGKVQLWEGGPYWAEMNIGADAPWDSGYYFWWGDTVGYKREDDAWVASDGSSLNFSFDGVPTFGKDIATLQSEGWITAGSVLAPEHDAAHVHWGGNWRMPTSQELSDLGDRCDWTWTTQNGVNGYVVHGRGDYASSSIFLPAAGYGYGTSLSHAGSYGFYWSSVPYSDYDTYSWYLNFSSGRRVVSIYYRYDGQSVRPVQGFTE